MFYKYAKQKLNIQHIVIKATDCFCKTSTNTLQQGTQRKQIRDGNTLS